MLERCLTLPKLRKTLATLPKTLDDTYARILCGIDEEYQQYASHVLQWLAFSLRPLHLKEIAEVVAIDISEHPKFDPQRRLPDPEDVVKICSSLITVTDHMSEHDDFNYLYSETYGPYVALAHFSVKEYLTSDRIRQGKAGRFHVDETDCHVTLTKDCLAYLFHFDESGSLTSNVFVEYPLAQYAAMYLPRHARVAEKKDNAICQDIFWTNGEAFRNWVCLYDVQSGIGSNLPMFPRSTAFPICYAWEAGLSESVRTFVDSCAEFNVQDEQYGNALIASSYIGSTDLVKSLLDERSDLDTTASFYSTALRSAFHAGHTEVVQILLEKGPAQNERANLALRSAIKNGDEDEAQSLIKNGADITWSDYANTGPLELALQYRLHKVADLMLDKYAFQGEKYTQALVEALRKDHHHIVQTLLDRGAVIDAEVIKAAMDGDALQLILDRVDVGLRDAQGRALCHHTASHSSIAELDALVKLGSDLTVTDKQGRTCLHHAVSNNQIAAVAWLLGLGLDVNATDQDGWTPLHWAAKRGHAEIVEVLENAGAKVSRENILGWSPSDVALFHGRTDLWQSDTAESKRSALNLEHAPSTANPRANARGIGGVLYLGSPLCERDCTGCAMVSRFSRRDSTIVTNAVYPWSEAFLFDVSRFRTILRLLLQV